MLEGPAVAAAFRSCGITHVVWLPDSNLGTWEPALLAEPAFQLIRVCREAEAIAIAAGLWLGGARPVACFQCTGLFDAGDALRNAVHDLKLPLFFVIGVRGYAAHRRGQTSDTCPLFTEPIHRAWQVPTVLLEDRHNALDLAAAYREARQANRAAAVLLAE
jgi:sulfopyruvate decarboxylase subunit alpha